ncbi:MAG TPA: hypothetical protein VNZ01_06480, partial [Solirubrobacteraceae bacterium]|nr:hypothetical protein [Solirubrobacteraceae bacterium]
MIDFAVRRTGSLRPCASAGAQMTALWIAVVAVAVAGGLAIVRRRRASEAGRSVATISNLEDSTSVDGAGAVRSLQTADLELEERALREIWTPTHLERLARTYWRFLTRVTLGLIRVRYSEHERSLV